MKNNKYLEVTLKLTLITALSALLIGIVFFATEDRIARARAAATNAAILEVFPAFNAANSQTLPEGDIINTQYIDAVMIIHNSANTYIGKAFIATTQTGRGHTISLVIGIYNDEVVGHSEIRFEQSDSTFLARVRRNLTAILPGTTSDTLPGINMEAGSTEGTTALRHLFNIAFLEYAGAELDLNEEETDAIMAIFPAFYRANSNVDFTSNEVITSVLPHGDSLTINRYIEVRNSENEVIGHVIVSTAQNNWGNVQVAIGISEETTNLHTGGGSAESAQRTLVGIEEISVSQSQNGNPNPSNPGSYYGENRQHELMTRYLIIQIQEMITTQNNVFLRDILSIDVTGSPSREEINNIIDTHFPGQFPHVDETAPGAIAGATRGQTLVIASIEAAFREVLARTR